LPSVEQKETHYQPGTQEEATSLLRDVMLPKARELQGFKGALILNDAVMNTGITITLWETEADLEASQPPDAIMEAIERLGLLLTEQTTRGSTRIAQVASTHNRSALVYAVGRVATE
jgi:hypothetical protein